MANISQAISEKIKNKEWLVVAVFILVSVVLIDRIIFVRFRARMDELSVQIDKEEIALAQGLSLEGKKESVNKEYEQFKMYYFYGDLDKDIMTRFLKEMERITQETGGTVISLTPKQGSVKEKEYKKYQLELQIEVSHKQFFTFLQKIQDSKLLIAVDSFSLSPNGADANLLKFDATINILVYTASL